MLLLQAVANKINKIYKHTNIYTYNQTNIITYVCSIYKHRRQTPVSSGDLFNFLRFFFTNIDDEFLEFQNVRNKLNHHHIYLVFGMIKHCWHCSKSFLNFEALPIFQFLTNNLQNNVSDLPITQKDVVKIHTSIVVLQMINITKNTLEFFYLFNISDAFKVGHTQRNAKIIIRNQLNQKTRHTSAGVSDLTIFTYSRLCIWII